MTDRERVIKWLTTVSFEPLVAFNTHSDDGQRGYANYILALLKEQEDVVRCKDCIHTEHCEIYGGWDGKHPDWYCADGERKEGR